MIELGFHSDLPAPRGPVSMASVMTNGIAAVLLVPIGALVFGEAITAIRVAGVHLPFGVFLLQR